MPIPFRRTSKTRKAKRRTHQKAEAPNTNMCPNCGATLKAHNVCKNCGYYKDKKVIDVKEK